MPHVKLSQVGFRALHDEPFFNKLKANPEQALEEVGWTLSADDLATLKKSFQSPPSLVTFDLPKFLKVMHEKGFAEGDWTLFCGDWTDPGNPRV